MVSRQETFNRVYKHLKAQGRPSSDRWGGCFYRGPEGLMCAVGCLIDDEDYSPDMEGESVDNRDFPWENPEGHDIDLLSSLQCAHDSWVELGDIQFWIKMSAVAKLNGLTIPEELK